MSNVHVPSVMCPKCGQSVAGEYIQQHIKQKHSFQCRHCLQSYETLKGIEDHDETIHLKSRCLYCDYRSKTQLPKHINLKHCIDCPLCQKSFISIEDVNFHYKYTHLTVQCLVCDSYFGSDIELNQHFVAKHCIKCPFCEASFISIEHLKFHDRYEHLTVKCYYCDGSFRSKEEVEQHIQVEHCFQCPGCSESFTSIELRKFHDKNVHLKIKCLHCGILFRKDEHLQQHIEDQHKFVCEWCKKSFKSPEEKNFHQGCMYLT